MQKAAALALLRLRLAPSAFCDVVAGVALAGGITQADALVLARTVACSVALYLAGMVFNDVADVAEDRRLGRPRPIVQGTVTRRGAALLGLSLLAFGLACAPWSQLGWLPAVLAALILAYDFVAKRSVWLGAPVLGACRALNLTLGWAVLRGLEVTTPLLPVAVCYGAYVALAVVHGSYEDRDVTTRQSSTVLLAAALSGFACAGFLPHGWWTALAAVPTLTLVLRAPSTGDGWVPRRTGILLRGLTRFTLGIAVGMAAWVEALIIAIPAFVLPPLLKRARWS